jgi:transposase
MHGKTVSKFIAIITDGSAADSSKAVQLIEGMAAEYLIAGCGYDTNKIVETAQEVGMEAVIPPKENRKEQRYYDKYIYKLRHIVENAFLELKRWHGIATRYMKNSASFLSAVHIIRCITIWLKTY